MSRGCDVLVVDDNRDLLDGLQILLSRDGYVVETETNGLGALVRLYKGLRPGLIVMDLMMPVMNGFEFREKQLADPTLAHIPMVAYSAVTDPARTAQQLRASAYVHKPSNPSQLVAIVRQLCPKKAEA